MTIGGSALLDTPTVTPTDTPTDTPTSLLATPTKYLIDPAKIDRDNEIMSDKFINESKKKMMGLNKEQRNTILKMLDSKGSFNFSGPLLDMVNIKYTRFSRSSTSASGYWSTSFMVNITMARSNKGKPSGIPEHRDVIEANWMMFNLKPEEAQTYAPGGGDIMNEYKRNIGMYLQYTGIPVAYHMINQEFGGGPVMPASHKLNMGIKIFENTLKNLKNRILNNFDFVASKKQFVGELAMVVSCIRPSWEDKTAMSYNEVYKELGLHNHMAKDSFQTIVFNQPGAITAVVRHAVTFGVIQPIEDGVKKFVPMSPNELESTWSGFKHFINYSHTSNQGLEKLGFFNDDAIRGNIFLFESEIKDEYRQSDIPPVITPPVITPNLEKEYHNWMQIIWRRGNDGRLERVEHKSRLPYGNRSPDTRRSRSTVKNTGRSQFRTRSRSRD